MIVAPLLLALAPAVALQDAEPGLVLRLDLRLSPVLDQYFGQRTMPRAPAIDLPEVEAQVEAFRALERAVGSPLAMGLVEGRLANCKTAADVRTAFESLPETARLRDGSELHLRAPALAVADALAVWEPSFLERVWPAHEPLLKRRSEELAKALDDEHLDAIAADLAGWLGFSPGRVELPVVLVASAPDPGAFTHRTRGGAVTFAAVGDEELDTALLCEIVVHEAVHAIDVSPQGQASLLAELRKALTTRGVEPTDPLLRDAVHTLFFLAAAEAVRRHVDGEHHDYGDVRGYYDRVAKVAGIERPLWGAYVAGQIEREELLRRLVDALAPHQDH